MLCDPVLYVQCHACHPDCLSGTVHCKEDIPRTSHVISTLLKIVHVFLDERGMQQKPRLVEAVPYLDPAKR
jgi:hypothetical protein